MKNKNIGSNFDDFLREEGIYEEVTAAAIKRVVTFQIMEEMNRRKLTKTEMASRMNTSRAALDHLLDPTNASVTLSTLERSATTLGGTLKVEIA